MRSRWLVATVALLLGAAPKAFGGEIVRITEENWRLVPGGKEVDAIYGDYLMRNDRVAAVIGDAVPGRHAHMSCPDVQGAVIDFALLETDNDQLTAFKPHGEAEGGPAATRAEILAASGPEIRLRVTRPPQANDPVELMTEYTLRDGQPFLRVTTRYRNRGQKAVRRRIADKMRCNQTFAQSPEGALDCLLFYDKWFRAAYEGQTARVAARLVRAVDSRGWIRADFHSHSSESGDNTTEPESRITCLAAEGVEFAPSTEHNRIQTYRHRLRKLSLERLLATSDGIELTGSPFALNHQNAFPLILKPGMQDGGAPPTDPQPRSQVRRLLEHDSRSEKLVQQNHPDIGWLFFDKDGDGNPDEGFGRFEFTHVIESWATNILAMQPTRRTGSGELRNNPVFNWLQLLNQGFRLPGVANTDAHYCFHQSGTVRNYVRSSTDDPAQVEEMAVVRAAKRGRIVMTNGPYLDISLSGALPGDDVRLKGKGRLRVRVQCANWLDVDRVQVLVNGRPEPALNFTRASHPQFFADGVVKFDREIEIALERDAHLIVVATDAHATTGPIMGQRGERPLAISNPIYVDVDGGGFKPSKDTLGGPLPTKKG